MSGGCCGWGYSSWNCHWYGGGGVYYHGSASYGNAAWHGGYYGGGYNNYGYHSYNNYNRNTNVSGNTVNVNNVNTNRAASGASSWDQHASSGGWSSSDASRGWARAAAVALPLPSADSAIARAIVALAAEVGAPERRAHRVGEAVAAVVAGEVAEAFEAVEDLVAEDFGVNARDELDRRRKSVEAENV